jgi:serine/threonine protein kinase/formylglycine-generating enzyme required for sulfatase activity
MPDEAPTSSAVRALLRINRVCDEFEAVYRAGGSPRLEEFVARFAEGAPALLEHLIPIDVAYRRRRGERPALDDYAARFPELDRDRLGELLRTGDPPFPPALGEYDLVRRIGAGGMGVVYLARHRRMNRQVALKAIPPDAPERDVLHHRFAREVEITARLSHPNVVVAFDAREDHGISYLVTEYFEGGDLGRLVRRSGPLPVPDAVRSVRAAALGLAHAHERGVIHRDVKPSNLFVGEGRVCVGDWGLARARASRPTTPKLTAAGMILGTVNYLAPELVGRFDHADGRSDVYSLGCVLFFLLVGRPPFDRGTVWERIDAHRDEQPPDVTALRSDVPAPLAALIARMLAKGPDERPKDMPVVVSVLDAVLSDADRPQRTRTARRSAPTRLSRRALLWGGASAALFPAAAFAVWRIVSPSKLPPPPGPTGGGDPEPLIAEMPFADAAGYQRQWAEYLKVPVERTDTVGSVKFRFVLVPPGTFRMGSPDELVRRLTARSNLDPWTRSHYLAEKERLVTIRRPFYLGKTEVTFAQFGLFVEREKYRTLAEQGEPGWGYFGPEKGWKREPGFNWKSAERYVPAPEHPVINTSWSDAVRFCAWLGDTTGGTCRLPAESEWEFACRGGRYGYWGHGDDADALEQFAVYRVDLPTAVGTRKPNGFGLLDMHGNAAERCAGNDPWIDDPNRPPVGDGAYPVRGGRFNELHPSAVGAWPDAYRAARRVWEERGGLTAGFRVLREIPT